MELLYQNNSLTAVSQVGGQGKLMVHPEDIQRAESDKGSLNDKGMFALYQGPPNEHIIDKEIGKISVHDYRSKGDIYERGAQVSLTFREDHILLIC
jgi:ABC-type Fe3+/spermidine/putrescine transport system ATPase subunit